MEGDKTLSLYVQKHFIKTILKNLSFNPLFPQNTPQAASVSLIKTLQSLIKSESRALNPDLFQRATF